MLSFRCDGFMQPSPPRAKKRRKWWAILEAPEFLEEIWITCPDGYETDCEAGCVPLRTQCREEEVPGLDFRLVNQRIFVGKHRPDLQKHFT